MEKKDAVLLAQPVARDAYLLGLVASGASRPMTLTCAVCYRGNVPRKKSEIAIAVLLVIRSALMFDVASPKPAGGENVLDPDM
jgi:hypothetical protein